MFHYPDNPHNISHSIIQDCEGKHRVVLYRFGRTVGGASNYTDAKECLEAAYSHYYGKQGSKNGA